jgi:hypothetical protein
VCRTVDSFFDAVCGGWCFSLHASRDETGVVSKLVANKMADKKTGVSIGLKRIFTLAPFFAFFGVLALALAVFGLSRPEPATGLEFHWAR